MDGPFPIIAAHDLDASVVFYRDALGMELNHQDEQVAVLRHGERMVLLSKSEAEVPAYTVAGWGVQDIHHEVQRLRGAGVTFDDFGFPHEDQVVTLGATQLAWFRDPSGNILSLSQWAGA